MTFFESIKKSVITVFQKYACFEGRASRPEFWNFYLACVIYYLVWPATLFTLSSLTCSMIPMIPLLPFIGFMISLLSYIGFIISLLSLLAILVPYTAVSVRRLHDIGKSGWNLLLIILIPIGVIILIVWFAKPSMAGENQYGPKPEWESEIC